MLARIMLQTLVHQALQEPLVPTEVMSKLESIDMVATLVAYWDKIVYINSQQRETIFFGLLLMMVIQLIG